MKRPKVLIVYKKHVSEDYIACLQSRKLKYLTAKQKSFVPDFKEAVSVHEASVRTVIDAVADFPVAYTVRARETLRQTSGFDLAVSIGGDGTFLKTARCVGRTPILAVNSNPKLSEAAFSSATARSFKRQFKKALGGELTQLVLPRLKLRLNGKVQAHLALNDMLITHPHPATISRYVLRVGSKSEMQKSSGIWVSTAAGSTGAVSAAGGKRQDWRDRRIQYRVREVYAGRLSRPKLIGALCSPKTAINLTWLVMRGVVCIDGAGIRIPLNFGDHLNVTLSMRDRAIVLGK